MCGRTSLSYTRLRLFLSGSRLCFGKWSGVVGLV